MLAKTTTRAVSRASRSQHPSFGRCMSAASISLQDFFRDTPPHDLLRDAPPKPEAESTIPTPFRDPTAYIVDRVAPSTSRSPSTKRLPKGYFSSRSRGRSPSKRGYATQAGPAEPSGSGSSSMDAPDSLFGSKKSAWDRIFDPIRSGQTPTLPSSALLQTRRAARHGRFGAPGDMKVRKQAMTANEQSTFDEMFNLIFTAATETGVGHGKGKAGTPSHQIQMEALGIGRSGAFGGTQSIVGLYDNLRGRAKNVAWTSDADEALDRKKEEMELCDTDQQLLEWAMQEVFGESQRYEAAAREAIAKAKADPDRAGSVEMPPLQPPAYSHLLAELMRTFRDKYRDPHLALSMFDHARHLSIPSYVFGCTTPAYNELIRTRWACFRDLRGVLEALEEMRVNGVEPDGTTRSIVENLRREVGERNLWEEHGQDGEKGLVATTGSDAVWEMLERIEKLSVKRVSKRQRMKDALAKSGDQHESVARGKKKWTNNQEWKQKALQGRQEDDGYEFGSWEENDRLRFA